MLVWRYSGVRSNSTHAEGRGASACGFSLSMGIKKALKPWMLPLQRNQKGNGSRYLLSREDSLGKEEYEMDKKGKLALMEEIKTSSYTRPSVARLLVTASIFSLICGRTQNV